MCPKQKDGNEENVETEPRIHILLVCLKYDECKITKIQNIND